MKRFSLIFLFVTLCQTGVAKDNDSVAAWTDTFDAILKKHVASGTRSGIKANLVDYKALGRDADFAKLFGQLKGLKAIDKLSDNDRLAFWINVYNYLTIYKVVQKPGIKKLTDLNGFIKNVWKLDAGMISGKSYTLDGIEHGLIRKQFKEPRIHVALVCAALSCPDLRAEAYRGKVLDTQLNEQMTRFLKNGKKGLLVDDKTRSVQLSSIFKWYGGDFKGGVIPWMIKNEFIQKTTRDYNVTYFDYNWLLNSK